jgi:hypothetical protein
VPRRTREFPGTSAASAAAPAANAPTTAIPPAGSDTTAAPTSAALVRVKTDVFDLGSI